MRDELAPVFAELVPVYEPWELARWFVQPNAELEDRSPVDALPCDLGSVLQAARIDRFVARG